MTFRPPRGNASRKTLLKYSSEPCSYERYNCTRPCIEDYSFCVRHILEDKNAPFKQCNYIYTVTGRRCPLPAPKNDRRDSYCAEHVRKMQLRHNKHRGTPQPPLTTERLLTSITHYIKNPDGSKALNQGKNQMEDDKSNENTSSALEMTSDASERDINVYTKCLNPFVDINATNVNNSLYKVLEYCSESDSDVDVTTIDNTCRIKDEDSSDAESIDSTGEDIFKYANVYTQEEISYITKEKLIRLQTLYLEQFKRLQHILKEKRRDYIHALQREKETLSSIADQPKETIKEQKLYEKLKSLNHYHKRFGVEAILHKKALEKRASVTEGLTNKSAAISKCIFTEGGVKCSLKTLPCAKYCNKHILEDPHQMLFRSCGVNNGVSTCQEPVLHVLPNENCIYHFNLPPAQLTYNTQLSSEEDDEGAAANQMKDSLENNETNDATEIKPEPKQEPEPEPEPIKTEDLQLQNFRDISKSEELPMQILEEKEVDMSINRTENEGDHMYYMSEDCLTRPSISNEECIVPFDSEESEDVLISTSTANNI